MVAHTITLNGSDSANNRSASRCNLQEQNFLKVGWRTGDSILLSDLTSLMPCSCMALNIYNGRQRSSSPQTVTFLCYNKCIHFLKLLSASFFPFGYILKYLLMLAVPIKNSWFGTLVAQHRTQVSGLETAVSAMGQNIEFSYPSFPLNGI